MRLVAGVVLLVAVGLLVAGLAATSALRSYQLERVDDRLAQAADSPVLRDDRGRPGGPGGLRGRLPGELYRALLDEGGRVVAAPEAGAADTPEVPVLTAEQARQRAGRPFTVDAVDGAGQWRLLAVPVSAAGRSGTVLLGSDLGEVDRTVARLVLLQLVIGGLVLAGVSVLGYVVVRSSLRGLGEVEQAAAAVAAGDLDRRVPERDPRTELGSLGASFNRMVGQVQGAFATRAASEDRLRRFVADAGHELRTPLTSIRGFAELHRQGAVTEPADVARLLQRIEDEAVRMGLLVDDLLALARLDASRPLERADVDLGVLTADAVLDARAVQPSRPLSLEIDAPAPVLRADEARLRQVLGNLLSNALRHTPATAPVRVRVHRSGGHGVIEVADDGPGMRPDVADRVFERFFRADTSRTRTSGGSGLGLSIVAALVEAHGGRVELDTAFGEGAVFRVLLPLDADPPAPAPTAASVS